jgi:hypothetical protein
MDKKGIIILVASLVVIVTAGIFFMLRRHARPVALTRPVVKKIEPGQNAWKDYEKAMDALGKEALPLWIHEAPGLIKFDGEQKEYLDSCAKMLVSVQEGARKPESQYFDEVPVFSSKTPNFVRLRDIALIALAQARRLELEGHQREAVDLELAVYAMGANIIEPNSPVIVLMVAAALKGYAMQTLFSTINESRIDIETLQKIARGIAASNRRVPDPVVAFYWERDFIDRCIEGLLLSGAAGRSASPGTISDLSAIIDKLPAVERVRLFNSFVKLNHRFYDTMRPSFEACDFTKAKSLREAYLHSLESEYKLGKMDPETLMLLLSGLRENRQIAAVLVILFLPDTDKVMKQLYLGSSNSAALQALTSVRIFEKRHDALPETLNEAFKEEGLEAPRDLATGHGPGYRIVEGKPRIWLAGFDNIDNGGEKVYVLTTRFDVEPGADFVYEEGMMPSTVASERR